jgi:prepilin-type N-terminal cleavage/methylation domain-containing protein
MKLRGTAGLTLLEVLVALAILGVLGAVFSTVAISNLRHTQSSGQRAQTAQVLNYLGRRVAGGDGVVLPQADSTLTWAYGELASSFPDLTNGRGFAAPDRYRVEITAAGDLVRAGARVVQYDLNVCVRQQEGESCVRGTTFGAAASPSGGAVTPPLPGIN